MQGGVRRWAWLRVRLCAAAGPWPGLPSGRRSLWPGMRVSGPGPANAQGTPHRVAVVTAQRHGNARAEPILHSACQGAGTPVYTHVHTCTHIHTRAFRFGGGGWILLQTPLCLQAAKAGLPWGGGRECPIAPCPRRRACSLLSPQAFPACSRQSASWGCAVPQERQAQPTSQGPLGPRPAPPQEEPWRSRVACPQ